MPAESIRLDLSDATGSWNFQGVSTDTILRCDRDAVLAINGEIARRWRDPLAALSWLAAMAMIEPPGVRWVGYLSYDLGRLFETIPCTATDDLRLPLFCFARCESDFSRPACGPLPAATTERPASGPAKIGSTFTRDQYVATVRRIIDYIGAGDVFQVNLSQRFTVPVRESLFEIAARLPPARYGGVLDFGDHAIISNSPELFFQVTPDRRIVTRPIKGTRPRGPNMEAELRDSVKDQAELNMIVDLERNDLGRICETGSVRVSEPRVIEEHPTVYHGAATIEGTLGNNVSFVDLLRAIFPGGSITGAPKIRAMEIIEALEPVRRGPYCGAIGYLAPSGAMEFNVAIRTMIVKDGIAHIHVGGGIVADSVPEAEYEETLVKAKALFAALGISIPD